MTQLAGEGSLAYAPLEVRTGGGPGGEGLDHSVKLELLGTSTPQHQPLSIQRCSLLTSMIK